MFTGIVQRKQQIAAIENNGEFATLTFHFPADYADQLVPGASVAINGVCLTVRTIELQGDVAVTTFEAINQTLKVTNIGELKQGSWANIERAAKIGDEIGGHLVSGHVYQTVKITQVEQDELNMTLWFELPNNLKPYIFNKGFVGLNGCSLTIADVENGQFKVCLIPETRDVTVFGESQVGDSVNLEVDPQTQAIVERLQQMVESGAINVG